MAYAKRAISVSPEVHAQLVIRGENYSGAIDGALDRYFEMLRRERATLRPLFSREECGLLLDVGNGAIWQAWSVPLLAASVEDSAPDGLGEKWEIDLPGLVAKLRSLSYAQCCALVDAIERWWGGESSKATAEYGKLLDEPEITED